MIDQHTSMQDIPNIPQIDVKRDEWDRQPCAFRDRELGDRVDMGQWIIRCDSPLVVHIVRNLFHPQFDIPSIRQVAGCESRRSIVVSRCDKTDDSLLSHVVVLYMDAAIDRNSIIVVARPVLIDVLFDQLVPVPEHLVERLANRNLFR